MDVGTSIGDCEILAHLSEGGMANLFLGRRRGAAGFTRFVAVKVVKPTLSIDQRFVRMFLDEANICARIDHPNVVNVQALGEADGRFYLVMEYVHGCPLSDVLDALSERGEKLAIPLAVRIAADIAEGLHAAHETRGADGRRLGIVHRDVSPQNVLLSHRGYVKLIDFGVAKARGRIEDSQRRSIKGKLRYMAPEQGLTGEVDRRSDIYSLGVVLWECLTMMRLFESDRFTSFGDDGPAEPPSRFTRSVPPALDRAVLAALALDPKNRPETASEFRRMLLRAVPAALEVESHEITKLLETVAGAELARRERALPPEVTQTLRSMAAEERSTSSSDDAADRPSVPVVVDVESTRRSRLPQLALGALALALAVGAGVAGTWWLTSSDRAEVAASRARAREVAPPESSTMPREPEVRAETPVDRAEERAPTAGLSDAPPARAAREPSMRTAMRVQPEARVEPAEPERAPPREAPIAATGTLTIVTPGGWANVYNADGRLLGVTPRRLTLPVGRHVLTLRPYGQPPARQVAVEVTAGGSGRVVVRLGEGA